MKKLFTALTSTALMFFVAAAPAFAVENADVAAFTHDTLNILLIIGTAVSTLFIVFAGYQYITSTRKPAIASSKT